MCMVLRRSHRSLQCITDVFTMCAHAAMTVAPSLQCISDSAYTKSVMHPKLRRDLHRNMTHCRAESLMHRKLRCASRRNMRTHYSTDLLMHRKLPCDRHHRNTRAHRAHCELQCDRRRKLQCDRHRKWRAQCKRGVANASQVHGRSARKSGRF